MKRNQESEDSDQWEEVDLLSGAQISPSLLSEDNPPGHSEVEAFTVPRALQVDGKHDPDEERSTKSRKGITKAERAEREMLHKFHLITIILSVNLRNRWTEELSSRIKANGNGFFPAEFSKEASKIASKRTTSPLFLHFLRKLAQWWKQEVKSAEGIGCSTGKIIDSCSISKEFDGYLNASNDAKRCISTESSTVMFAALLKSLGFRVKLIAALYPIPLSLSRSAEASASDTCSRLLSPRRGKPGPSRSSTRGIKRLKGDLYKKEQYRKRDLEYIESRDQDTSSKAEAQESCWAETSSTEYLNDLFPVYPFYLWCEVLDCTGSEWVPVDPVKGYVKDHKLFEPPLFAKKQLQFSYIIASEFPHSYSDITSDYTTKWSVLTSKIRLNPDEHSEDWWCNTLKIFNKYINAVSEGQEQLPINRNKIFKAQLREPMPTSISGFKNHPLYALESQLKKTEIIYPLDPRHSVGIFRNKYVYPRSNVYKINTKMVWLKCGRKVLSDASPVKVVSRNCSAARKRKVVQDTRGFPEYREKSNTDEFYASFQTEVYVAKLIVDGNVPVNSFGNFELFHENMLPNNAVHIKHTGIEKIAKQLNISYAPALVGFEHSSSGALPLIKGIVAPKEKLDLLESEYAKFRQEILDLAEKKRKKRIVYLWKKAISFALSKVRIYKKYGSDPLESKRTLHVFDAPHPQTTDNETDKSPPDGNDGIGLSKMWDFAG